MSYEVWAIDAGAGEAILRHGGEWMLVSLDKGWVPQALGGPAEALRWSMSSFAVPVGKAYETWQEAVADVREATLAMLGQVFSPSVAPPALVPEGERHRRPPLDKGRQARAEFLGRAMRRSTKGKEDLFSQVIASEGGRLERHLERHGLSREERLDLMTLAFEALFDAPRGWNDEHDLATRLFAQILQLEKAASPRVQTFGSAEPGDRPLEDLIVRGIGDLPQGLLELLVGWTNLERSYSEIQAMFQVDSPRPLERQIRQVARAAGLAAELLRVRLFAPACGRAARAILARRGLR